MFLNSYYCFKNLYYFLVLFPFAVMLLLLATSNAFVQKRYAFVASIMLFFSQIYLFTLYLNNKALCFIKFGEETVQSWASNKYFPFKFIFYFDNLSMSLLLLTAFIFCLVIYYLNNTLFDCYNYFVSALFCLWGILNLLFCTTNLLLFYFLFELSLFPMFFIIGRWGSSLRRMHAAVFFVMYTSMLSLAFLLVLLCVFYWVNSLDFLFLRYNALNYYFQLTHSQFEFVWCLGMMAFFAKLPLFPFHIWLPEAHVEAPTAGSVVLASMLLKVGAYAIISFLLPFSNIREFKFFGIGSFRAQIIMGTLVWVSFVYVTMMTLSQVDLKKIIAYSSVAHMSMCMLGLLSYSTYGYRGSYLMLIAHGFSSAGLFFVAGMLYVRFGTSLLKYYSGLHVMMPQLSFFAFFFFLANIGFPGTLNFISEFLMLLGIVHFWSPVFMSFFGCCFVLSIGYSIWIYNKIFLGTYKVDALYEGLNCFYSENENKEGNDNSLMNNNYYDLVDYEKNILTVLTFATIFFGLFPNFIL